jgi:hypothetical protein
MTEKPKVFIVDRLLAMLERLSPEDRDTVNEAIAEILSATGTSQTPQREIFDRLRAAQVDVRAEVRLPTRSPRSRSGYFRADLAVYNRGRIVALCECKAWKRPLSGRQLEHYETSGYPYIVAGKDTVDHACQWLIALARVG